MGDVFRLVYFIDTFCQQLSFRVIENNHGQAVVWRQRRPEVTDRGLADVGAMTFTDLSRGGGLTSPRALRWTSCVSCASDLGLARPDPERAARLRGNRQD